MLCDVYLKINIYTSESSWNESRNIYSPLLKQKSSKECEGQIKRNIHILRVSIGWSKNLPYRYYFGANETLGMGLCLSLNHSRGAKVRINKPSTFAKIYEQDLSADESRVVTEQHYKM